jgi:hypothetical protein
MVKAARLWTYGSGLRNLPATHRDEVGVAAVGLLVISIVSVVLQDAYGTAVIPGTTPLLGFQPVIPAQYRQSDVPLWHQW